MLEDLKKRKEDEAGEVRRRLASEQACDELLMAYLAEYRPVLDEFCSESGWVVIVEGVNVGQVHAYAYGEMLRALHVSVAGPERPFLIGDSSGVTRTGLRFALWFDDIGFVQRRRVLRCLTYQTVLAAYDSPCNKQWTGVSLRTLEESLRGAYKAFG